MSDIKKAIFIRHKLSTSPAILEDLWRNRKIAIHYENLRSVNPDDYKTNAAKNALKRLQSYCKMGVVVGAFYREIRPAHLLVGVIPPGSTIEYTDQYGEDYVYKTVKLHNAKEISLVDYPLLAAIQPRLAAITGWTSAFTLLYNIAFDKIVEVNVKNLSPSQLEVICHEYLRMKGILKALLLPIGRNLLDIDIWGIGNEGYKIAAQVTHSTQQYKVDNKFEILKAYKTQGAKLIFFGPKSCQIIEPTVDYICIEDVFLELRASREESYPRMIEAMFKR